MATPNPNQLGIHDPLLGLYYSARPNLQHTQGGFYSPYPNTEASVAAAAWTLSTAAEAAVAAGATTVPPTRMAAPEALHQMTQEYLHHAAKKKRHENQRLAKLSRHQQVYGHVHEVVVPNWPGQGYHLVQPRPRSRPQIHHQQQPRQMPATYPIKARPNHESPKPSSAPSSVPAVESGTYLALSHPPQSSRAVMWKPPSAPVISTSYKSWTPSQTDFSLVAPSPVPALSSGTLATSLILTSSSARNASNGRLIPPRAAPAAPIEPMSGHVPVAPAGLQKSIPSKIGHQYFMPSQIGHQTFMTPQVTPDLSADGPSGIKPTKAPFAPPKAVCFVQAVLFRFRGQDEVIQAFMDLSKGYNQKLVYEVEYYRGIYKLLLGGNALDLLPAFQENMPSEWKSMNLAMFHKEIEIEFSLQSN